MAFVFKKPKFLSTFSIVAVIALAFGLGLTVLSTQQRQTSRSMASTTPNANECNTQVTGRRCCSVSFTGGMCKYTNEACPGGFIPQTNSYTSWYCPGGNDYRCCLNAPSSASVDAGKTVTLPTDNVTLNGSCSDADTDSRKLQSCTWTKVSGPDGEAIQSPSCSSFSSCSTQVTGLKQGAYVFRLTASDNYAPDSKDIAVTVNAAPVSQNTKINLDLLLHGIGKAGDSVTPGEAGGGNMHPNTPLRQVTVQLLDAQGNVKFTGTGYVNFQPTGNFTGKIDMGNTVTTGSYVVKVKFAQSLNTAAPGFYAITAGAEATIPQFSLVTGDINNDGAVSVSGPQSAVFDYNILRGCYSYFQPPVDCDDTRKAEADLDDDGHVNQSDLNLFLRELSHIQ